MSDLEATTALIALFADPTRVRLMALLEREELTVAELTRVTGLSQSRVSTHLGKLRDSGLLHDRKVGVSTFYRVSTAMPEVARVTWDSIRIRLSDAVLAADRARATAAVRARTEAAAWPDQVAGRMEHHYSPGRTWEATARGLLGLLRLGDVLDVGSGDGAIASLLAPRARSITCLDRSAKVIDAARERLDQLSNVEFALGDMHEMPVHDASFDQVILFNVLTYAEQPAKVVSEAFRVLRPQGTVVAVTLDAHDHDEISSSYNHVNRGFAPPELSALLNGAGFELESCAVSSRERRKPYFQVVTAIAYRPAVSAARAS